MLIKINKKLKGPEIFVDHLARAHVLVSWTCSQQNTLLRIEELKVLRYENLCSIFQHILYFTAAD